MASTTLDLPEPLGPTTHVMPGSSLSVVVDAKDLKPLAVKVLRCTALREVDRAAEGAAMRGWTPRGLGRDVPPAGYRARPAGPGSDASAECLPPEPRDFPPKHRGQESIDITLRENGSTPRQARDMLAREPSWPKNMRARETEKRADEVGARCDSA